MVDYNESEVLHNIVSPNVFQANAMIELNQDSWKKLPAHLQKLLKDAAVENLLWAEAYYRELEKKSREELAKRGVKFNTLSKAELARWRKMLYQPERDWFLKETGPEGKALLNIVDKYDK